MRLWCSRPTRWSHRDIDELAAIDWGTVVLDEAQSIKNPGTAGQARAVRRSSRPADRPDRHAGREPPVGVVVDHGRCLNPGLLGTEADVQGTVRSARSSATATNWRPRG